MTDPADIECIERELRDEAEASHFVTCDSDELRALLDELSRLREVERKLRAALEPFVDIAEIEDEVGREDPEDDRIWVVQAHGCQLAELSVEDFKAAARAFTERTRGEGEP